MILRGEHERQISESCAADVRAEREQEFRDSHSNQCLKCGSTDTSRTVIQNQTTGEEIYIWHCASCHNEWE